MAALGWLLNLGFGATGVVVPELIRVTSFQADQASLAALQSSQGELDAILADQGDLASVKAD